MARRRKKKNTFKPILNFIILIILLVVIVLLIQKFVIPLFVVREKPKLEEKIVETEIVQPSIIEDEQVTLYFADASAQYLIPEYRTVKKVDNMAKQAIIELIKGPVSDSLYPTIPSSTRVNDLFIGDGIAYIDLSSEIVKNHSGGSAGELITVYSLVLTLTNFPGINKVQILVDGNSGITIAGHVDTSMPFERDNSWLKTN